MKKITDPSFVYHSAQSHSDPAPFSARMKEYAKMVAAEPKKEPFASQAYLAQMPMTQKEIEQAYMGMQGIGTASWIHRQCEINIGKQCASSGLFDLLFR